MTTLDEQTRKLIDEAKRLKYSRRGVIQRGSALGLSAAGITSALSATGLAAPRKHTRYIQGGGSLTILAGSYFVPEAQDFFVQQVTEWGAQNNTEVTCDFINWPDIQARISSAVESGAGPDIVEFREGWQYLYYEQMIEVNDLANTVGETSGGFYDWVTNTASVDGVWHSIPVGTSASAFAYRKSYLAEAGFALTEPNAFPATWEELFALGKTLKEMGKPLGQALGHSTGDPPSWAYPYMWAYGAMEVEEDGTTIAFNKPEFVEGMNLFITAWKDAFDETGLSWDDGANNRAFLSDQISATLNGSSVYIAAVNAAAGNDTTDYGVVVDPADIDHGGYPSGPAGRFNHLNSMSYGAMKYSDNQEAALALLEYWTGTEPFTAWLEAQKGYIIPPSSSFASNPVYTENPVLAPYLDVVNYGRNKGFAGPANQKAATAGAQYVVVDTFAKAIQNNDAQGAIEEGASLLERIYSR